MDWSEYPDRIRQFTTDLRDDNRGVVEGVSIVASIAILLLFSGAIIGSLQVTSQGSEIAQRNQITFEGQKVAGELAKVDRLVRSSNSNGQIGRHISLSDRIGNRQYQITTVTEGDGDQKLILQTVDEELKVTIPYGTRTTVEETTVQGGDIYIVRNAGTNTITIVSEE
jgi:hypothetical protein